MSQTPEEIDHETALIKRVGMLAAAYPSVALNEANIKVYVRALWDIPLTVLDVVIDQAIAIKKFMPVPAELVELAHDLSVKKHLTGFEAWSIVQAAASRIGCWNPRPEFGDPLITRAVDCLGWRQICLSDNPIADRAHFVNVFEQLVRQEKNEALLLPAAREMRALADQPKPRELKS